MPKRQQLLSIRAVLLLALIAAVAISFSIASFQYSKFTSERIESIAAAGLDSQGKIQSHNLAKSLENKLQTVNNNLQIIASAPLIKENNLEARSLINTAQESTAQLTDSYFWVDKDGRLLWANAFRNQTIFDQYYGADRSDRPYFTKPEQSHQPYFSALRESVDGIPRIFMAIPILDAETNDSNNDVTFKGIIGASFNLHSLAQDVSAQVPPGMEVFVNLMDRDGTILYTRNDMLLGKNYFSQEVQDLIFSQFISVEQKDSFNALLRDSLAGNTGVAHFTSSDTPLILAYAPVNLNTGSEDDQQQQAFSLLLVVPGTFASDIAVLIEQQRIFSTLVPASIGGVAIAVALLILRWNRSLQKAVDARTADLVAANEQVKAHDRMQTEFVNIAAHELRTPIQPIIGVVEMLKDSLDGKKEVKITDQEIALLDRSANRLYKLSSEILDATRIESGTLKLELEQMDINEKVKNAIADIKSMIPESKDIRIDFKPHVDDATGNVPPLPVMIDKLRMFEVISNLLRNSIKYINGNVSVITVSTHKDDDNRQVRVSVKDQGKGISSDVMPRLFGKFSTDKERGGTGLGLFIAKNIIEAHGGKIWAENNASGQGATFTFVLPLAQRT